MRGSELLLKKVRKGDKMNKKYDPKKKTFIDSETGVSIKDETLGMRCNSRWKERVHLAQKRRMKCI